MLQTASNRDCIISTFCVRAISSSAIVHSTAIAQAHTLFPYALHIESMIASLQSRHCGSYEMEIFENCISLFRLFILRTFLSFSSTIRIIAALQYPVTALRSHHVSIGIPSKV